MKLLAINPLTIFIGLDLSSLGDDKMKNGFFMCSAEKVIDLMISDWIIVVLKMANLLDLDVN